jgi:hypothetical protein
MSLIRVAPGTGNTIYRESGISIVISREFPGNILLNESEKIRKYEKVGNITFQCQIVVRTKEITQDDLHCIMFEIETMKERSL